jgi:preprotein translocase subunit SecE
MAKTPVKGKKQARTLRQTAEDKSTAKKRSLKAPVKKVTGPLGKVKNRASKGFLGKIGRFLLPKYFRNSWQELRKVSWPDRRQTARLTFAVIAFATVFGVAIAIVDYGLDKLFRELLLK